MLRPRVCIVLLFVVLGIAVFRATAEDKIPGFLSELEESLFRPGKNGVKSIHAVLHWKSGNTMETQAKTKVDLKGLDFDISVEPAEEGATTPSVTAKLKNPPRGAAPEDVEGLQYMAANQVEGAFENPVQELREFLAAEGAKLQVDEKNKVATATEPSKEGIFFVQLVYRITGDGNFLDLHRVGAEGIMDRSSLYQFLWKGSGRILAGVHSGGAPGVWRGVQRTMLYQSVQDAPVLQRVFDVQHDESAKNPQEVTEVELTDVTVTKE